VTSSPAAVAALLMCGYLAAARTPSRRRLAALVIGPPSKSLVSKGILGVAAGVGMLLLVGLTTTMLAVAAGGVMAWTVTRARARRAEAALRAGVVELLRAVAGELRSGRPAGAAFSAAAESADPGLLSAIAPLAHVAAGGDPGELAAASRAVASSGRGLAGLARFAACWQVADTSGAALAPAIDRVADALHDEIEFAQSLAASLAAPRATVRLLAALPVVGLALGGVLGARPLAFLLDSPAGLGCLAIAAAFDVIGLRWGRRIARRAALTGR
jgi:tight adherence protein B